MTENRSEGNFRVKQATRLGTTGDVSMMFFGAQILLLAANLLLLVNLVRSACPGVNRTAASVSIFRQPATLKAPAL